MTPLDSNWHLYHDKMLTHFSSQHLDIAEIMRLHFAVIRIEANKMFEYLDHNGFYIVCTNMTLDVSLDLFE